jgi:IS5 family transposase
VQEKAITYPTDAKLAIKIINRLNKLAKYYGIAQRRTFTKEVKKLRLALRHFRHVKRRAKAKKGLKRLRTIAGILIRELRRPLPKYSLFEIHQKEFLFYERVLVQQPKDKNKIYSLHEPDVYCIGKGKDHKQYEYGNKVSIASTAKTNIIVGVASHERNIHDNHTLPEVLAHIESSRGKEVKQAVCDRGYRGKKKFGKTDIILPAPSLKKDTRYQRDKKRQRCRRRAAIEPIIGHLKTDFRLTRNFLKGTIGDSINLLMAACAWNMAKWMRQAILFLFALVFLVKTRLTSADLKDILFQMRSGVFLGNLDISDKYYQRLFQG